MSFFKSFLGKEPISSHFKKQSHGSLRREWTETIRNNMKADSEISALDDKQVSAFLSALEQAIAAHIEQSHGVSTDGTKTYPPVDSTPVFHVADNHMAAYVCLLPPLNDGEDMTPEQLEENLYYEGISWGIDKNLLARIIAEKNYLHIHCIAKGTLPQDGQDGLVISQFFECRDMKFDLEDGELPDFHQSYQAQPIHKGEMICHIQLPTKAVTGRQITGQLLPARDGTMPAIPAGENTIVSNDKQFIFAAINGVVFFEKGNFVVQLQHVVAGDADSTTGNIYHNGDLCIQGAVKDGVTIQSSGNILVEGEVIHGHLIASGSIRIQKGIAGTEEVTLKAGRQIQCSIIKNALVEADGNIYAEVIFNSTVTSTHGAIYALIGRGMIIGGHVLAHKSIYAKKIGNHAEILNKITAGYAPELLTQIDANKQELAQSKEILKKLRSNISLLHMAGSQLSPDKRAILGQLVEQRTLYEAKEQQHIQQIQQLTQALYSMNHESVVCDEMFPITEISIGTQSKTVQSKMLGCNVRIHAGQIMFT